MAKIRVEVNLLKSPPDRIWIGVESESTPLKGFFQKLEYKGLPKYCTHSKKLGHNMTECRVLERKKNKNVPNLHEVNGENINIEATGATGLPMAQKQLDVERQKNNDLSGKGDNMNNQGNQKTEKDGQGNVKETDQIVMGTTAKNIREVRNDQVINILSMKERQNKKKKNEKKKMHQKKNKVIFKSVALFETNKRNKRNKVTNPPKEAGNNQDMKGFQGEVESHLITDNKAGKKKDEQIQDSLGEETHVSNTKDDHDSANINIEQSINMHNINGVIEEGEITSPAQISTSSFPSIIRNHKGIKMLSELQDFPMEEQIIVHDNGKENNKKDMDPGDKHRKEAKGKQQQKTKKNKKNEGKNNNKVNINTVNENNNMKVTAISDTEESTTKDKDYNPNSQSQGKWFASDSRGRSRNRKKENTTRRKYPDKIKERKLRQSALPPSIP
ncbi:uncharacterized protein LOC132643879 [Lycium barbarum]|uniref:uncharacterized protein LOC132643879 n=1 Tax=Lycium barbarum TaxID=112863 RepID=UPI00293E5249|nr:uncharacterized protein LOC132643879 [Lycium barbarum]